MAPDETAKPAPSLPGDDRDGLYLKGRYTMPFQPTPRSVRDDVAFDLDEQYAERKALADELAHCLRRVANINRLRNGAVGSHRLAQELEDAKWDGTERRRNGHIVTVMQSAAEAEIAAAWDPREVAA